MPLIASAECDRFQASAAERVGALVEAKLISFSLGRSPPPTKLELCGWHRVATIVLGDSPWNSQATEVQFVGWHAFVSAGSTVSHLVTMTEDGQVAAVLRGRSLSRLQDALTYAEQQVAAQGTYEPIYLRVNPGETDALWLRSDSTSDPGWIIPLESGTARNSARKPFTVLRPADFRAPLPRLPA